nr:hypothetical protein [Tanacetum cinerariifolium]
TFVFFKQDFFFVGKVCAVTGFEKSSDTLFLVTDVDFEKSFLIKEFEKVVGLPKTDGL